MFSNYYCAIIHGYHQQHGCWSSAIQFKPLLGSSLITPCKVLSTWEKKHLIQNLSCVAIELLSLLFIHYVYIIVSYINVLKNHKQNDKKNEIKMR